MAVDKIQYRVKPNSILGRLNPVESSTPSSNFKDLKERGERKEKVLPLDVFLSAEKSPHLVDNNEKFLSDVSLSCVCYAFQVLFVFLLDGGF